MEATHIHISSLSPYALSPICSLESVKKMFTPNEATVDKESPNTSKNNSNTTSANNSNSNSSSNPNSETMYGTLPTMPPATDVIVDDPELSKLEIDMADLQ